MHRSPSTPKLSLICAAGAAGLALLLSGCAQNTPSTPATSAGAGKVNVVTSTNVYGDIAKTIGGDHVEVTSLISKVSQDPHSYEATAQDRLAVSQAKLIIENGGGYDDFLTKLVGDTGADTGRVLSASEISGLEPAGAPAPAGTSSGSAGTPAPGHGGFNEHVWYNFDAMARLADAIAGKLGAQDSASAAVFTKNAETFKSSLKGLSKAEDDIKAKHDGAPVAITEPVPLYLLQAAGLVNKTPEEFSAAIEEGTDVPVAVLKEATDQIARKDVKLLAYNDQTEGPQTEALKKAAESAGVPVVNFTETLPQDTNYLDWMDANVRNIAKALTQ